MGEIIRFPGTESTDGSDPSGLVIHSLGDLYDEGNITFADNPNASIADVKRKAEEMGRVNALKNIETTLAQARGKFIVRYSRTERSRKKRLVELAKYTYVRARDLEHTELMDWARNELIRGLGIQKAMTILESIQIKDQIEHHKK